MTDEPSPVEPEPEKFYSPKEVAELFSISHHTVSTWIREGKIQAIKIGPYWRIAKSEVLRLGNQKYGPSHVGGHTQ